MAFGPNKGPGTFQRLVDVIIVKVKCQFALVYLDDVIVFSSSVEEHIEHVETVLRFLKESVVTHNLERCAFFKDAVYYLAYVIRPAKLEVATRTKDAIVGLREPRKVTEMRLFLGLCIVLRRLVPNFAIIAAPLNRNL